MNKKPFKFYVKKAMSAVVYLLITLITGIVGISFSNDLLVLKIILGIMNIGLYAYFVFYMNYKTGEESMSVRFANDINRMEIIKTGKDIPLKTTEEFKWWKGFFIGLLSSVPLLVLWIIHFVLVLITGSQTSIIGGITISLYVFIVYFFNLKSEGLASSSSFYFTSLYVPFVVILSGVGYLIGGRKALNYHHGFEEMNKEIYGE